MHHMISIKHRTDLQQKHPMLRQQAPRVAGAQKLDWARPRGSSGVVKPTLSTRTTVTRAVVRMRDPTAPKSWLGRRSVPAISGGEQRSRAVDKGDSRSGCDSRRHHVLDPGRGKEAGLTHPIPDPLAISLCFRAETPTKNREMRMQTGQMTNE